MGQYYILLITAIIILTLSNIVPCVEGKGKKSMTPTEKKMKTD